MVSASNQPFPVLPKCTRIFFWSPGLMFSHSTTWGWGQEEWGLLHFLSWEQKKAHGVDSRSPGKSSSGLTHSFAWKRPSFAWSGPPPIGLLPARAFLARLLQAGVPGGEESCFFLVSPALTVTVATASITVQTWLDRSAWREVNLGTLSGVEASATWSLIFLNKRKMYLTVCLSCFTLRVEPLSPFSTLLVLRVLAENLACCAKTCWIIFKNKYGRWGKRSLLALCQLVKSCWVMQSMIWMHSS